MATLHQLFSADPGTAARVSALSDNEDSLLLLGDGCYLIGALNSDRPLYALQHDLQERGLTPPADVRVISDDEWVQLTLTTDKQISWY